MQQRSSHALLLAAFVALGVCLSGTALSKTPSVEQKVAAIEQYCSEMERLTGPEPDAILGVAESAVNPAGEWRRYASKDELHKAWEGGTERNRGAYVWLRNGEVVRANFTLESPSGDWVQYSGHCFRDGSLARLNYELRTTYNQTIVRRQRYYDEKGHPLRSYEQFLDLRTEQPKRAGEAFIDEPTTVYHRVSELPFIALVRKSPR
jgi:hypothetical protein